MNTKTKMSTKTLVLGAVLTALVILLQMLGSFVRFGPFSISLVLIPIVIGAATCGKGMGTWLGFVFGAAVLLSGDAAAFLAVHAPGTVLTVLAKGTLCGFLSGLTYQALSRFNRWLAVILAAVVCPLVNTGVFLLGCIVFFMETIGQWAAGMGLGEQIWQYIFVFLIGGNFLFELGCNIVLSPVIVRLLNVKNN